MEVIVYVNGERRLPTEEEKERMADRMAAVFGYEPVKKDK